MDERISNHNQVQQLLNKIKKHIDNDSINAIQNYLDVQEYEMAFEAIFLELFEMNINPFYQERDRIIELAIAMNLNDENNIVLGGKNFWEKLNQFVNRPT